MRNPLFKTTFFFGTFLYLFHLSEPFTKDHTRTCSPFYNIQFCLCGMASDYSETNLKIDWRFFQWVSRQAFERLTLSAVTARSGRLSQSATTLSEKKDKLSFILKRVMKIFLLFPVSESVLLL